MGAGFRHRHARPGDPRGRQHPGHRAERAHRRRRLRAVLRNCWRRPSGRLKQLPPKDTVDVDIDLPGEAYMPRRYVPDMRLKIDLYRRLARQSTREELPTSRRNSSIASGLGRNRSSDYFHEPSWPFSPRAGMSERFTWKTSSSCCAYSNRKLIEQLARQSGGRLRIVDGLKRYLPLEKGLVDPERISAVAKSLLQPP